MINEENIQKVLDGFIQDAENLKDGNIWHPHFRAWQEKVVRRLSRIYGEESRELQIFLKINFQHKYDMYATDEENNQMEAFSYNDGLVEVQLYFEGIKEELTLLPKPEYQDISERAVSKIFISHSSIDKELVSEIVQLLTLVGIPDESIFCTSLDGHGIPLGDDWLETLKNEISSDVLVLFVLSENYYKSTVSICEMGAAWALSKKHIPIVIPPLDFKNIQELGSVIPPTQGFKVDEKHKWTMLKPQLEKHFNLTPKNAEIWESKRDEILKRIEKQLLKKDQ